MWSRNIVRTLLVGATVLSVAACSSSGVSDLSKDGMQDQIKEAFLNSQYAESGKFDVGFDVDLQSEEVVGSPAESLVVKGSFFGAYNSVDKDLGTYESSFDLSGTGSYNGSESMSIALSVVMKEESLYFILEDVPTFEDPELASVNTMAALFKGKWWSVPVPAEVLSQTQDTTWLTLPPESDDLTEEQKQLHELFKAAEFFESVEFVGTESVDGVRSDKFEVVLDAEGIFDYAVSYGEISGDPMSVEDEESLKALFESSEIEMEVYIAQKDKYLSRVVLMVEAESTDSEAPGEMSLVFDFVLTELNKPQTIEAPEDATPFDLGALLGAPGAGGFELN